MDQPKIKFAIPKLEPTEDGLITRIAPSPLEDMVEAQPAPSKKEKSLFIQGDTPTSTDESNAAPSGAAGVDTTSVGDLQQQDQPVTAEGSQRTPTGLANAMPPPLAAAGAIPGVHEMASFAYATAVIVNVAGQSYVKLPNGVLMPVTADPAFGQAQQHGIMGGLQSYPRAADVPSSPGLSVASAGSGQKRKRGAAGSVGPGTPVNNPGGFINPYNATPKSNKHQMKWTPENTLKLALFGFGRDIRPNEYSKIASMFPKPPSNKAIQEKCTKLRKRTLELLAEANIYQQGEEEPSDGEGEYAQMHGDDELEEMEIDEGASFSAEKSGGLTTRGSGRRNQSQQFQPSDDDDEEYFGAASPTPRSKNPVPGSIEAMMQAIERNKKKREESSGAARLATEWSLPGQPRDESASMPHVFQRLADQEGYLYPAGPQPCPAYRYPPGIPWDGTYHNAVQAALWGGPWPPENPPQGALDHGYLPRPTCMSHYYKPSPPKRGVYGDPQAAQRIAELEQEKQAREKVYQDEREQYWIEHERIFGE